MTLLKTLFIKKNNIERLIFKRIEQEKSKWLYEHNKQSDKEKIDISIKYEEIIIEKDNTIKLLKSELKRQRKLVPMLEGKIFAIDRIYEYLDPTIDEIIMTAARIRAKKHKIEQIKYNTYKSLQMIKNKMKQKTIE